MKRIFCGICSIGITVLILSPMFAADLAARAPRQKELPAIRISTGSPVSLDVPPDFRRLSASAVAGTTVLGAWDFDAMGTCSVQGWTSVDLTAPEGEFWHVDDFAGLGGGSFGRLYALEGSKSLWLGARPNMTDPILCGYAALPGYGNSWSQSFCTKECLNVSGDIVFDYLVTWDSEPGYDGGNIEWDNCDNNWILWPEPGTSGCYYCGAGGVHFDGWGEDSLITIVFPDSLHNGQARIRFNFFSDGAWSDEDGLWDTDGALIFDSLVVRDAAGELLAYEDFESYPVGATTVNDWEHCNEPGFGDFSGLVGGFQFVQEDPCRSNLTCAWTFFNGSPDTYDCGGFPGQLAMPFGGPGANDFLNNRIESPWMQWMGSGTEVYLDFDVYRDLPLDNLQFYQWHIRSLVDGCPGSWQDDGFVFYGGQKDWLREHRTTGYLIHPNATDVQVALAAVDMCWVWCGSFGSGSCHSHAPIFDNVTLYRIGNAGPRWSVRDLDLFQDTFPLDGTTTGICRADQANDVTASSHPAIIPGDSTVVTVVDSDVGLKTDPITGTGPAVYAYVAVWPQGQPGKSGAGLTDDASRWPVVDSTLIEGTMWYQVRFDTVYNNSGTPQTDRFCIDLHDSRFAGGDTICFFFSAENTSGQVTYYTRATGGTPSIAEAAELPMEFTCLPAGGYNRGGRVLYVDGMDGRGAQPFFDSAFDMMGIRDEVDRYDIRAPSSLVNNRPGARVTNVYDQIINPYRVIIWNTGDLSSGLIGNGLEGYSWGAEKSEDAFMLFTFLDQSTNESGVYFSGDDIADWLYNSLTGSTASALRSYITGMVNESDHVAGGLGVSPLAVGAAGGCFDHIIGPDTLIAYGGCPLINDFDIITPTGTATTEMSYHGQGNVESAIIGQTTLNAAGTTSRVMLSGFSYHSIRDDIPRNQSARAHHLYDIMLWLGEVLPVPTGGDAPLAQRTRLNQNYPNPFNPTTTIGFTLRERSHVTLRVYNVAGQLVRTLVDEVRASGVSHTVDWDGRDARGTSVASGVYFYRLVTKDATRTRKMVLLK